MAFSIGRDKRNGRVTIRSYAGKSPETGGQRSLYESLPPDTPDDRVAEAARRLEARASHIRDTGLDVTLDGIVEAYIGKLRNARRPAGTVATYRSRYRRHISPRHGGVPADRVTPRMISDDLAAAVDGIDRPPISASTANGIRALLHAAYESAIDDGLVSSNPVRRVRRLESDDCELVRVFTEDEIAVIVEWASRRTGGWDEACAGRAAMLALATGLRVGEVCALRRRDVNMARRLVYVTGTITDRGGLHRRKTKGKRSRFVSIDADTASWLGDWMSDVAAKFVGCEWLFPTSLGDMRNPKTLSKSFSDTCARLGLGDGRRFHELRHTHATMLLERGESPKTVTERIGDSSAAYMLKTYAHALPAGDRAAADKIGGLIGEIASKKEGVAPYGH